ALEGSSPIPADRWLEGETELDTGGLSLTVVHTPGHSPGHLSILLQERGVLFSGDHVLGLGTTVIMPGHGDMAQYISSLERLQGLELSVILPGHGPPVRQPRRKLIELIEHRKAREEQVLALLERGVDSVEDLVRAVYPELEPRLLDMARGQTKSHLIKLEREGRIVAREGCYSLA
ncbi:MAG: MBL fold metallo-hydrolase, partial [Chloroflexi bacterium]|nr:MBL fold metallo-hydrolase [Chloroflexota bacterium]